MTFRTLAVLTLMACGTSSPAPDAGPTDAPTAPPRQSIRLALNWVPEPEFGGFYQGVAAGIYADAGFDVTLIPGGPGAPTVELLASGQADVAVSAGDDLLLKRTKGATAVGVWPAFQRSPMGVMVHPGSGLTRFEDVQGGRFAVEIGGPLQRFLWGKYGWEGKVEMVPTTGAVASFLADPTLAQQAYVTAEPCAARMKGVDPTFLAVADAGWNPYGTLLVVPSPPPAWTGKFVAATQAAWTAYLADPTAGNAEIAKQNDQMTPELLACLTESQKPFLVGDDGLGKMTKARWDELASAMVGIGLLPAGSTADGAWVDVTAP